jgi:hypothetical protein
MASFTDHETPIFSGMILEVVPRATNAKRFMEEVAHLDDKERGVYWQYVNGLDVEREFAELTLLDPSEPLTSPKSVPVLDMGAFGRYEFVLEPF